MPFEMSPDPKFIWLSEKHKEALATLKYGILENKGYQYQTLTLVRMIFSCCFQRNLISTWILILRESF
jgi:hypothetical protein